MCSARLPIASAVMLILFLLLPDIGLAARRGGVEQTFLQHPTAPDRQVELYWQAPQGSGRTPALLFVHGHQYKGRVHGHRFDGRPGGLAHITRGDFRHYARLGLVVAAVSQPGYGSSDGPPDFCGPLSQQAVHAAIAFLREHPRVDPDRIVLFGHSRGAVVSSVVATEDDRLAGIILRGGIYDLEDAYKRLDPETTLGAAIRANIDRESGGTRADFVARSALAQGSVGRAPTLFLHGENDDRSPTEHVRALAARLKSVGTPAVVHLFRDHVHRLPSAVERPLVAQFLRQFILTRSSFGIVTP